ncbi:MULTISPECIES: hypothetical protein [unclassified Calothrix]|uniref:hypothetical protein n=1 Tax=unclassified Calothrix TaxID=2619626 RepID=UPI00168482CA|nr:hypothetical protein [Calothrix sp. FACHB-168]MBD2202069.1 hypothetical protein [Calothrix sp. FACHB-168]
MTPLASSRGTRPTQWLTNDKAQSLIAGFRQSELCKNDSHRQLCLIAPPYLN